MVVADFKGAPWKVFPNRADFVVDIAAEGNVKGQDQNPATMTFVGIDGAASENNCFSRSCQATDLRARLGILTINLFCFSVYLGSTPSDA